MVAALPTSDRRNTVRGTRQEIEKRVKSDSMLVVGKSLGRRHSCDRLDWLKLLRPRNHSRRMAGKLDLEREKWLACRLAKRMAGWCCDRLR